mmetsp:Transcript_13558/g.40903  ORF Transcript_13558/g.40903 Transcript_13558/m.40903 type:complete len:333 (-) Transcript_13558:110-1108(-)|eukprot:CAMPEP_0174235214 /NCGR_PEP_ID=MMETSP0417-20130205/4736_1 /TAXON_ID=242541 /ORGANISM="Mayorella sp, Strain BSH-02190019" /LENGTH=332 /DNA_ID=CAMNT_0015313691 /DNA_START=80 /DNA_END=1078 /DNA_ORIENTATION=-
MVSAQAISNYFLGALEAVLCVVAAIQLTRLVIHARAVGQRCLAKKAFHTIVVAVMLLRFPFFLMLPTMVHEEMENSGSDSGASVWVVVLWNHSAETLFFLSYFIVLLFWADFYSHLCGQDTRFFSHHRIEIAAFVAGILATNLGLLILVFALPRYLGQIDAAWEVFSSALFVLAALGFAVYALLLYHWIGRRVEGMVAINSPKRRSQGIRIGVIGSLVTLCFLLRAALGCYSVWSLAQDGFAESFRWSGSWYGAFILFLCTEILPTALMMWLLRAMPKAPRVERQGVYEHEYGNEEAPITSESFCYDPYQSNDEFVDDMVDDDDTTFFVASD